MISLENDLLKASFSTKGAELQSLTAKEDNFNYLWNGNPNYWGKFSPVLFPIVGGLKNNTYYVNSKVYHLPRHGFARDMDFELSQTSSTSVIFRLTHNDETLKVYPFHFVLEVHYELSGSSISCTYQVYNPDYPTLLFSIGAHPAFATPVDQKIAYIDYFLEFNGDHELTYHKIKQDLIDHETATITLKDGRLPLQHSLFYEDALVFKTLKSDCITLRNNKNKHGIHFKFSHFPYFGIWAAKDADFVCLEPWCGIADGIDHQQNLENKEGIVSLASGDTFIRKWEVTCF